MTEAPLPLPRSISAWVSLLWSRVLFGGTSVVAQSPRVGVLVLLLLAPAALLYPSLGFHLFEPDESRYAQIPREMLQRGDWVVPVLQDEPYLDKPPLVYWLIMLAYQAFGYEVWAARLVPALAVHLTLLVTYIFGCRTLGERPARWAALLLLTAPGFVVMSRLLILDGVLMLFVVLALFTAFEAVRGERFRWSWWWLSAVACGLGVLTKGPVALVLLAPPIWLYLRLAGRGSAPRLSAWAVQVGVILAIALPWYVALALRVPDFVTYFFWEHNVQRFLSPGVHVRGVWFYFPVILLVLLPGALLLFRAGRFLLSEETARHRSPELGFHLLAGAWCVLFFTLSACKLPTYILPALPSLALVFAYALVHSATAPQRLVPLSALGFGLLLFTHYVALPWYAEYRSPMSRPAAVLALCADPATPVVCYPRNCDSIAFYLGRNDLRAYRSKEIEELRYLVRTQPRTVILCTHRSSLAGLKQLLPPEVRIVREERFGLAVIPGVPARWRQPLQRAMGETALGLSDVAVVEMPPLVQELESSR